MPCVRRSCDRPAQRPTRHHVRVAGAAARSRRLARAVATAADVAVIAARCRRTGGSSRASPAWRAPPTSGFMSNAGFVVTSDGVVVFDALGTPALGRGDGRRDPASVTPRRSAASIVVALPRRPRLRPAGAARRAGAEIWAHRKAERYFTSGLAAERLAQRRADLYPVGRREHARRPARPVARRRHRFPHGRPHVPAHLVGRRALAGGPPDVSSSRIACCSRATCCSPAASRSSATRTAKGWLGGDGPDDRARRRPSSCPATARASRDVARDLATTRDYLAYLRDDDGPRGRRTSSRSTRRTRTTDWSRFARPAGVRARPIASTRTAPTCGWSRKSSTGRERRRSRRHRMTGDPVLAVAVRAARRAAVVIVDAARDLQRLPTFAKEHGDIASAADDGGRERDRRDDRARRFPSTRSSARSRRDSEGAARVAVPLDHRSDRRHARTSSTAIPYYAISIALDHGTTRSRTPSCSTRCTTSSSPRSRGKGAQLNGAPIRTSACTRLEDALVGTVFPHAQEPAAARATCRCSTR